METYLRVKKGGAFYHSGGRTKVLMLFNVFIIYGWVGLKN
jgi:hypothetical protein